MNFSLVSSSSEIRCPCSKFLQQKNDKPLLSKIFMRLNDSNQPDHARTLNQGAGRVGVYQPLTRGHVQESSIVLKSQDKGASLKFKYVRTLLIDNYDSYTYNIYQELSVINGVPPVVVHNDELTWDYIRYYLYEEKAFDNIVVSPGPGSPTCPTDIGICLRVLQECKDIPILGVCLGHQALGYVHGAKIIHAPEPFHGRLSEIEHTGGELFHDIPSGRNSGFNVVRYHSLVVDAESLPQEVIPIAWSYSGDILPLQDNMNSAVDKNTLTSRSSENLGKGESTKVIMAISHLKWPHYGVQFHPESIATCHGKQIFENFRKITVDYWLKSSRIHDWKVQTSVCTQMPFASQMFRGLPKSMPLVNGNRANPLHISEPVVLALETRFLKLRWTKLACLASQLGGSKEIFCELFGDQKAENTFWLDSSSIEQKRARFSFMGCKGGSLWKQLTFRLANQSDNTVQGGGYLIIEDAQGAVKSTFLEDGFFDYLNKELRSFCHEKEDYEGLPFDFCGGYVGFMGYDLKAECGMESNRHKSRAPDACFFFADNVVAVDHQCDEVYILSLHDVHHQETTNGAHPSSTDWLANTERRLLHLKESTTKRSRPKEHKSELAASASCRENFSTDKSRDQYMKDVEKCLDLIKDGESYELCLTTQMRKRIGDIDSLGLYLELRERNPAPYAAWLNFPTENVCICCSSPERFLQLDRTGLLEAKPIKGTIARGSTPVEDEQLKSQLQYSKKDQAENLMIVDLLRNDLGRVSEPGSVHVSRLMEVESYATVHTMVSTIHGKKCSNMTPVDCVKAAFPGGSMTGAPKLRSMELLDSIESCSRGVYSGSIGFFSYNQTFDLNIVIRTVVIHEGEASIGAGGAIVALSNPQDEYEEMILKTRAPVKTVMEYQSKSD